MSELQLLKCRTSPEEEEEQEEGHIALCAACPVFHGGLPGLLARTREPRRQCPRHRTVPPGLGRAGSPKFLTQGSEDRLPEDPGASSGVFLKCQSGWCPWRPRLGTAPA
jgi:hypothetical protein